MRLDCGHCFHESCLERWFEERRPWFEESGGFFFLQNNVERTNHSNMGHDKESERCIVPVLHRIFALGNLRRALDKI